MGAEGAVGVVVAASEVVLVTVSGCSLVLLALPVAGLVTATMGGNGAGFEGVAVVVGTSEAMLAGASSGSEDGGGSGADVSCGAEALV